MKARRRPRVTLTLILGSGQPPHGASVLVWRHDKQCKCALSRTCGKDPSTPAAPASGAPRTYPSQEARTRLKAVAGERLIG